MQLIRSYGQAVPGFSWPINGDRIGVVASVLCAIHCAVTPLLLLFLPVFGKAWSHPASHWLMALLVVPLAAVTVSTGYKKHRRKWVIASGVLGILLVLVGAAAPSFEKAPEAGTPEVSPSSLSAQAPEMAAGECTDSACLSECGQSPAAPVSEGTGAALSQAVSGASGAACVDSCCPSIQTGADGEWRLHIPLASVLTTIGGLFLIVTHLGNLCRCACCEPEHAAT